MLRAEVARDRGVQGIECEIGKRRRILIQVYVNPGGQPRGGLPAGNVTAVYHGIDVQRRYRELLPIRGIGNNAGQGHGGVQRRTVAADMETQADINGFAVFQLRGRYIDTGKFVACRCLPVVQGNPGVLDVHAAQGDRGQGHH